MTPARGLACVDPTRATRVRVGTALAAVLSLAVLGGCGDPNSIAAQAKQGNDKGYIAGDGTIEQLPPDKRIEPITLSGTTLDGTPWSSASLRGKSIAVVNVWGSWCAPCVAEIPDLEKVWGEVQAAKKPVQFIGVNVREDTQRGAAFAKSAAMTYPSLTDKAGVLMLAFGRQVPTATPSTVILDREGRVAARVSGPVTAATLRGLIDDVLKS